MLDYAPFLRQGGRKPSPKPGGETKETRQPDRCVAWLSPSLGLSTVFSSKELERKANGQFFHNPGGNISMGLPRRAGFLVSLCLHRLKRGW